MSSVFVVSVALRWGWLWVGSSEVQGEILTSRRTGFHKPEHGSRGDKTPQGDNAPPPNRPMSFKSLPSAVPITNKAHAKNPSSFQTFGQALSNIAQVWIGIESMNGVWTRPQSFCILAPPWLSGLR